MKIRILLALVALMSFAGISASPLRLPHFFADGMVLQRGQKIPVWGWGEPGTTVRVTLCGKTAKTTVRPDGTWRVLLPKQRATFQPQELTVTSLPAKSAGRSAAATSAITLRNILIGDVYLCSGQSNMELPIRRCMDKVADLVRDYSNPNIRYLKLPHQYNYVRPNDDCRTLGWQDITPQNCAEVSAICYFMARHLQEVKSVPIGIVNSAVGGTRVESWMPQATLARFPAYASEFGKRKYQQTDWPDSVARVEARAWREWDARLAQTDTVLFRWRQPDYHFDGWKPVDIFSDWGRAGNGSYWFRHTVSLPAACAGQEAVLRLGAMKDADSVFVNGTCVGNTTYEYPPRIYKVPAGLLREGDNEVIVHLMSQRGRANFTRGKLYQLEVGTEVYPISPSWQMAQGSVQPPRPGSTYFVDCPTGLYNAMIAPLRDFPFSAILWYQGESNQGDAAHYADYLCAMIQSWRTQFHRQLPVVIMQLPGYMARHDKPIQRSGWCDIREQQRQAALRLPFAALAATLDTGEWNDIHPQDKQIAGERAALQMRRLVYGEKNLASEGPHALSARRQADGSVLVTFSDGQRHTVTASTTTWSISPDGTTLRYCYDDYPQPEIFSANGIPTPQFEIAIDNQVAE